MRCYLILAALVLVLVSSCSVQRAKEGSLLHEDQGWLIISGDMTGKELYLQGQRVELDSYKETQRFGLQSGVYELKIYQQETVLLSKTIIITAGQTQKVSVP